MKKKILTFFLSALTICCLTGCEGIRIETLCVGGTSSDSGGSCGEDSSTTDIPGDDSSETSSDDYSSSDDSSSSESTPDESSSTPVNATIKVLDAYPTYSDIGDTINLDEYVAIGDGSDYTAEVTSGSAVVSLDGHTLTANTYGEYTITLTSSYESATIDAYVNSPTMTAYNALLEDIDKNYVADFIIGDTAYVNVYHNENYFGVIDGIYGYVSGAVKLGNYGYVFNASSTDFSDAECEPGAYDYDNLYMASSFPIEHDDLLDLYNSSGDVLIDGSAAYYLSYYTIGYNLYNYGVEFYSLSVVEDEGEAYYWFTGWYGNDTDGYTNTGYHIRIHSIDQVSIDALENLRLLSNVPEQIEHDALAAAFTSLNNSKNYTMNVTGYYYDSTNGTSVSNSSLTAADLASIGFVLPYSAVSYVNDVSYYAEVLSGYCMGNSIGSYTSIAGDVYSINQYTSGGVTDTAVLTFSRDDDGYTFEYGAFTDEFETAWDTTLTPASITKSSLNKVNFLDSVDYEDEGVTNYQYSFDGLTDDGAFLESLIRMMPVYGDSIFEYFKSYEEDGYKWTDLFDSSNCVIACTDEGDIYGQIATYSFNMSSSQAYRYILYFEITDIGDTLIDNEYLASVDWSLVQ